MFTLRFRSITVYVYSPTYIRMLVNGLGVRGAVTCTYSMKPLRFAHRRRNAGNPRRACRYRNNNVIDEVCIRLTRYVWIMHGNAISSISNNVMGCVGRVSSRSFSGKRRTDNYYCDECKVHCSENDDSIQVLLVLCSRVFPLPIVLVLWKRRAFSTVIPYPVRTVRGGEMGCHCKSLSRRIVVRARLDRKYYATKCSIIRPKNFGRKTVFRYSSKFNARTSYSQTLRSYILCGILNRLHYYVHVDR